jgi:hypothetical protein
MSYYGPYVQEQRPGSYSHKPKAPADADPNDYDDGGASFLRVFRAKEKLMTTQRTYDARTLLQS